jgi:lipoprotein-releasing system ATP-binding protein
MLKARDIHKSYGDLEIVRGIDLDVSQGEIVSIVGASGAGKSTLLHIIGTLDQADRGSLQIGDKMIMKLRPDALSRFRNQHIGFIFQFHHLLPEFTALENVCMPALIAGKSLRECGKRAEELLSMLGVSHRKDHKPNEISGGEQQRVAIARALINNPSLVLADEPSGNLDSQNASELNKLLLNLRNETGQTFIIVTHSDELAAIADRKLVMKDGLFV